MRRYVGKKLVLIASLLSVFFASLVYSHCQIPCGIYGDRSRFDMLAEHISTIEKSMKQITELAQEKKPDFNQIVRWVTSKEKHADEFSHIVTYYFLAQRIKPVDKAAGKVYQEYIRKLTLLHEMLIYSVKAKQANDLADIEQLRALLTEFQIVYFDKDAPKGQGQACGP